MSFASDEAVLQRAERTGGVSQTGIYELVADFLRQRDSKGWKVLDLACGQGNLRPYVEPLVDRYHGANLVRHDGLPPEVPFYRVDPSDGRTQVDDAVFDAVLSLETIDHMENPRAFARELVRLTKPGGWIVVTTPNQLSFRSKLTLVVKNHFNYFGPSWCPAHLSALLEVGLRRIAGECRLEDVEVLYGNPERLVLTPRRVPRWWTKACRRAFSANVTIAGRKPRAE